MIALQIEPHDVDDDTVQVSTDNVDVVCDNASVAVPEGNLKLGYAAMTLVEIHIGDVETARIAKNAVGRAIRHGESWTLGEDA